MAANTVGTDDARAPADDPYRAVAEHLPDAAVVLFDLDLRIQLTTGTTMPDSDWLPERCVGRSLVDLAPPEQAEAWRLRVALYRDGPPVVLAVEDDGCGFDPIHTETVTDAHGFGLSCMRERLQAIGGQLTLRTAPGAGTCIEARAASQAPP